MRLDAWLKQPHTPVERLRLVERLAQALNAVHDRGETLASIAPERVEVGAELKVSLAPSARGRPEPGYAAPERLDGGTPTTAADIYSVGAVCWEILVGRPCGEAPKPLADVAPELPRELANSVMGCLERGAEWRPKDLTYLAQLAAAQQKVSAPPGPAPRAARTAPAPRSSTQPRSAPRRPSRSMRPLFVAAVLLIAAAASSYFWLRHQEAATSTAGAVAPPPAVAVAATPEPVAAVTPTPEPAPLAPTPTPRAVVASATPTPAPRAVATAEREPLATPAPTPPPTPTPAPTVAEPSLPRGAPAALVEPPLLSTLSPLSVRRPGRVLLDLRGTGLRSDLRVSILPLKEVPRGITVIRQKWTSVNLVSVLLELDASVTPAAYGIALEDASGNRTNPLSLTITK